MSEKALLGVIGGSGPQAGLNVVELLLSRHKEHMGDTYKDDKSAVSIIMIQEPGIGGPHGTWDLHDPNSDAFVQLWKYMINSIWKLHMIDVKYFCITCNTLHFLEPLLQKWMEEENIKPVFVSIVEVTKSAIYRHQIKDGGKNTISGNFQCEEKQKDKVAILGSLFTTDLQGSSPYAALLDNTDVTLHAKELSGISCQSLQQIINDTKRCGPTSDIQNRFSDFLEEHYFRQSESTVDFIVMACTELPLLLTDRTKRKLEDLDIIVINPNAELAEEMLMLGDYIA